MQVNIIDFENRTDSILKAMTDLVGTQKLSEQRSVYLFKITVHAAPVGSSDVAGLEVK
jgi:hypothetical protein